LKKNVNPVYFIILHYGLALSMISGHRFVENIIVSFCLMFCILLTTSNLFIMVSHEKVAQ
jgi:hypothetical protein